MLSALAAHCLWLLAACGTPLGHECTFDEDCRSGICAPVSRMVCSGVQACTQECETDEDCAGMDTICSSGLCRVDMPEDGVCY